MAGYVYSERFLLVDASQTWIGVTVPPGKRAIVKSLLCSGDLANVCVFQLAIADRTVFTASVPASEGARNVETYCVAYAGEVIKGYITRAGTRLTVSGYLLNATLDGLVDLEQRPATAPDKEYPTVLPSC